jgi:hypothetical protein
MLKNHPDKNADPNSARIAQCLNDAKDKAVTVARQNKKIADHLEELKGYTRQELMSNTTYSQLIFSKVMSMQRDLGIGGHRLMDIFIGGYYRLVNHLKERISTLEDSVVEEKAKAKQIEEQKTSKINTLISSLNSLQEKLEVERRSNEMISEANIELTREKDNTALEIEMLKRERDDALSKVSEVTAEKDAKINELIAERDNARRERDEAVSKINKPFACEKDNEEDETTPMPSAKKRKLTKVLSNYDNDGVFGDVVRQFIECRIRISPHERSFLTPRQIMEEFERNGHNFPSEVLFFKELRKQMEHKHPCTYKNTNGIRKYDGMEIR